MQTRRDQLQAYRFQNRRALSALVTGQPNVLEAPMRRLTVITLSGVMIAILIAAGFALVAVFKPAGGDDWKQAGAVIDVRGSGARYVLFPGKVLHPVLNYSSAALVVGTGSGAQSPHIVYVDPGDIKGTTVGAQIGIAGLPDSLPSTSHLITSPWTVCSRQTAGTAAYLRAEVDVYAGSTAGARRLGTDDGVLVQSASTGETFLLAGGRRYAVASTAVETALNLQGAPTLAVGTAFINAVPPGPDLAVPKIPDAGRPSGITINGKDQPVGTLLLTSDTHKYSVVLSDGTAALSEVETGLVRALDASYADLGSVVRVSDTDLINIKPSGSVWSAIETKLDGLPESIPTIEASASDNGGVCVIYRGADNNTATLSIPSNRKPSFDPGKVNESATSAGGRADSVKLPFNGAALVRSSDGAKGRFLIAGPGKTFALPSGDVVKALGYDQAKATALPARLLALIPLGPPMDPTAARRPVS